MPDAKDIASLWTAENAIVNQKTNYYFGSMALLTWPTISLWLADKLLLAALLALIGVLASVISFVSIARTAAYRDHWRKEVMDASPDYAAMFRRTTFKWFQRIPSNGLLIATPLFGLLAWLSAVVCLLRAA